LENNATVKLTRRQQEILGYLRDNAELFDYPPTLDELCRHLGMRSRGSLHKHVRALIQAGFLEPIEGRHRGVRLASGAQDGEGVPYLGKIAAGRPIEAWPQPELMEVPALLRPRGPCFVLRVEGDSMIEAGILDGDYVVVEQCSHAANGDIVVALVRGEEVTLKRITQSPGRVTLHPANASMDPLEFAPDEVAIQGVVVGQMRSYR
jgi:repressor LexA